MYYPGLLFLYSGRIEPLWRTLHGSQSLKYSLCALTGKLGRALLYSVSFSSPAGLSSPVLTCLLTYFLLTSFTPLSHFFTPCQCFLDILNKWLVHTFLTQSGILGEPNRSTHHVLVCPNSRANWLAEQGPLTSRVNISTMITLSRPSHPLCPVSSAALFENSTLWAWLFLVHIFYLIECHLCTGVMEERIKSRRKKENPILSYIGCSLFTTEACLELVPRCPCTWVMASCFQPHRTWPSQWLPPLYCCCFHLSLSAPPNYLGHFRL